MLTSPAVGEGIIKFGRAKALLEQFRQQSAALAAEFQATTAKPGAARKEAATAAT